MRFIWIPVHPERHHVSDVVRYGYGRVNHALGERKKEIMAPEKPTGGGGM